MKVQARSMAMPGHPMLQKVRIPKERLSRAKKAFELCRESYPDMTFSDWVRLAVYERTERDLGKKAS